MRTLLAPLALVAALGASPVFAFDMGNAMQHADSKAQAGLDTAAQAQDKANAHMDATQAAAHDKAATVDATTGLNTSEKVDKADTKVEKHKHKANTSASRAHKKGTDAKASMDATAAGMGMDMSGATSGK